jgi:hypothetical protein
MTPAIKDFHFQQAVIRIESDSAAWMESFTSYLSLPAHSGTASPDIRLSLAEVSEHEMDLRLPLPEDPHASREVSFILDRIVPCRMLHRGPEHWRDFSGFGRLWWDSRKGTALALRLPNSGISPIHADVVFGYNTLVNLLSKAGVFSVHASSVQVGDRAVLFTGDSGSGKSTAAFALLRKGYPMIADDRTLVYKDGCYRAGSISDVVKVRTEAMEQFFPDARSEEAFHQIDGESMYKLGAAGGWRYQSLSQVGCIVALEKTGDSATRLEKINPVKLVGHLFPVTLNIDDPSQMVTKFGFLMEMLREIPCFRLHFGTDMDRFVEVIGKALA